MHIQLQTYVKMICQTITIKRVSKPAFLKEAHTVVLSFSPSQVLKTSIMNSKAMPNKNNNTHSKITHTLKYYKK